MSNAFSGAGCPLCNMLCQLVTAENKLWKRASDLLVEVKAMLKATLHCWQPYPFRTCSYMCGMLASSHVLNAHKQVMFCAQPHIINASLVLNASYIIVVSMLTHMPSFVPNHSNDTNLLPHALLAQVCQTCVFKDTKCILDRRYTSPGMY
jgi:hypothetical protein